MSFQEERTRAGTRLFHPEEVATVIDMFAPVRHALEHARSGPPRPAWRWREWRIPALVAVAILTVGVTGAALQARAVVVPPPPAPPPIHTAPAPAPPPAPPQVMVPEPEPEPEPVRSVRTLRARPTGDEEALAALNRRAVSEYERSRPAAAVRLLSEALRLCQRPALAWNPSCATTHVNLGRVLIGGYRQSGLAAKHFRIADAIRPGSGTAGGRALQTALTSGARSATRGR